MMLWFKASLVDKDYDKFYNDILYIARKNGREKEFLEGIEQNEKYKSCMGKLKEYTMKDNEKGIKKEESGKSTQIITVEMKIETKKITKIFRAQKNKWLIGKKIIKISKKQKLIRLMKIREKSKEVFSKYLNTQVSDIYS